MNIKEVIESSRKIVDSGRFIASRTSIFSSRGRDDSYEFLPEIKRGKLRATKVTGGVDDSVLSAIRETRKERIYWETVIFSEAPRGVVQKYRKYFEKYETFCWVEEYKEPISKLRYFKIKCVALTFEGARFATCKDLMHIYTGSTNGIEPSDALFKCAMNWRNLINSENKNLDPETMCFYHAMEMMFPWPLRKSRNSQFDQLRKTYKDRSDCAEAIAKAFLVPVSVAEHFCRVGILFEGIPYCGLSHRLNSDFDKVNA